MSRHTAAWLAWSLGILWALLLALTFLFFTLNLLHPGVEVDPFWIQTTVVSVSYPALGLLLASRRPEHPIGWLFCAAGLVVGLEQFCAEYANYALLAQPGSLPGGQAAVWVDAWVWVPFTALCAFLVLLFPDGRLPSRRWLPFAWLVGIATVAFATVAALWPGPFCVCPIDNLLGIETLEGDSALDFALMETLFIGVLGLPAMSSLYLRFRRASSVERQQIKWFAYAGSVVVLAAICRNSLGYIVHSATGAWWAWWIGQGILSVGFASTAIAMSIAILKYRLYEIDLIIRRSLVIGPLITILTVVFELATQLLLPFIFQFIPALEDSSSIKTVVSVLIVVVLFKPLHARLDADVSRLVDRLVAGRKQSRRLARRRG